MREVQNFISESEASNIAGLSATTLKSFAEAGYLQVESDADGIRLYSKKEIEKLFGPSIVEPEAAPVKPATPKATIKAASTNGYHTLTQVVSEPTKKIEGVTAAFVEPSIKPPEALQEVVQTSTTLKEDSRPPSTVTESVAVQAEDDDASSSNSISDKEELTRTLTTLRRENSKLKTVVDLQEKIIQMKDQEVQDLRGQRDWLHTRIERLDEKNHRDQILLLSETQAIRELIHAQQPRKSPLRSMLEFFGMVPHEPQSPLPAPSVGSAAKSIEGRHVVN